MLAHARTQKRMQKEGASEGARERSRKGAREGGRGIESEGGKGGSEGRREKRERAGSVLSPRANLRVAIGSRAPRMYTHTHTQSHTHTHTHTHTDTHNHTITHTDRPWWMDGYGEPPFEHYIGIWNHRSPPASPPELR